eukprot:438742-Rhodomonas_salina.2
MREEAVQVSTARISQTLCENQSTLLERDAGSLCVYHGSAAGTGNMRIALAGTGAVRIGIARPVLTRGVFVPDGSALTRRGVCWARTLRVLRYQPMLCGTVRDARY